MAYGTIHSPSSPQAGEPAPRQRKRLAALSEYEILDSEAEGPFDEIVFIAKTVCHVPIALISLVEDDRQWFKSRIGLDACETPISQSVCFHGMASNDLLVIPDLTTDPRTSTNTLVTGDAALRFYAGAPLVTPAGVVIGMLCVIDHHPRPGGLDPAQRRILSALAAQVVDQLELRKSLRVAARELEEHRQQTKMLTRATKRLQLAEEAGNVGAFEIDLTSRQVKVSPEFCRIYGIEPAGTYPLAELVAQHRSGAPASMDDLAETADGNLIEEFEIERADGARCWVEMRARHIKGEDQRTDALIGIVTDITDQRAVNEEIAHRLKNTLALVQAVAGHTLRDIPDPAPVQEFNRRIAALATAHDLLLSRTRASCGLQELAKSVFAKLGIEERVACQLGECELSSRTVLILSMLLHELSTNAMKYGPLGVPDGTVSLSSRVEERAGEPWLFLDWVERGGPPASPPERKGLGTRLIERGIDGDGEVTMDFAPEGLSVMIAAPLAGIAVNG